MKHLALSLRVAFTLLLLATGCERFEQQGKWNPADPEYDAATDPNNSAELTPIAPSALEAVASSVGPVVLSWRDNSDHEEGFVIRRKLADADAFEELPETTTAATYADTGIEPATEYVYQVAAYNAVGRSDWCAGVAVSSAVAWEINVQQDGADIAGDGTGQYLFVATTVGSTTDAEFTIQSVGTGNLELTGLTPVTLSGADEAAFVVTAQPASPVAAGGGATFTIQFAPQSSGTKTATVSVASNDVDEGTYSFALSGSATLGEVIVSDRDSNSADIGSAPAIAWSGTEYALIWGDQAWGTPRFARISAGGIVRSRSGLTAGLGTVHGCSIVWACSSATEPWGSCATSAARG